MNASVRKLPVPEPAEVAAPTGLALLRAPFPAHQISKLPKPYKKDSPKAKCAECGGYHGLPAVHLDYVGHAALTDRLLDCDPEWAWEPVAFSPEGQPAFDRNGGMWIKLTVCGVTRYGYGSAEGKSGGDAVKEIIGDALRNAAMRFGAALDLWHKGDLHVDSEEAPAQTTGAADAAIGQLRGIKDPEIFKACWAKNKDGWKAMLEPADYARVVAVMKECSAKFAPPKAAEPERDDLTMPYRPSDTPTDPYDISADEIPF